jgi:hypothetical protein
VADNTWHFIVATLSSSLDFIELYIDGQLSVKRSSTLTSISDGAVPIPFEIGRMFITGWDSPKNYFNGSIDEVRIYNRTLSDEEIKALFKENATPTISPTIITSPPTRPPLTEPQAIVIAAIITGAVTIFVTLWKQKYKQK